MRRPVLLFAAAVPVLAFACLLAVGAWLSRPAPGVVGPPPATLAAVSIRLPVTATQAVAGWFAQGSGRGAVLLLHGIRADRTQMLGRASMLHAEGYSVLLPDLPAHGESDGARIGFGVHEAAGVAAALRFLRTQLPGEPVGVIGVSLGAAALVFARPSPAPDAVVLESLYPTLGEAVANRLAMRFGPAGRLLAPLLLWQTPWWIGVPADAVRPVDGLAQLVAPVLVAAGTHDRHTPWPETERIFAQAREPRQLWAVPGAAHADLHAHDPQAYRARVLPFLDRYLRGVR